MQHSCARKVDEGPWGALCAQPNITHANSILLAPVPRFGFVFCFFSIRVTQGPSSDPVFTAMSTVPLLSHSSIYSANPQQGPAASALPLHALLRSAPLCYAKEYKESLLCSGKQHKHFLNETSQTRRQIPIESVGRPKLFHHTLSCQELRKCFNEVWTAPRRGHQINSQRSLVQKEFFIYLSIQVSCSGSFLFWT